VSDVAFVLGNGKSRLNFDLNQLRGKGTIYGCNAIYRDFLPDVLIATDDIMREEIETTGINPNVLYNIPAEIPFYTRRPSKVIKVDTSRRPWQTEDYQNNHSRKIDHNWGYSSGPVALTYACLEEHSYIYLIGHDLMGVGDDANSINNLYAGTNAYKPDSATATYFGNWVDQIRRIITEYSSINFARVGALNNFLPETWQELSNHREITFEQFNKEINNV
jgi:hypothetical protein